ncbi:MAG: radical SAM protein [Ignisphaera sp.]
MLIYKGLVDVEKVLVIDANARCSGKRFATLDVIGVGPRLITALLKSYGFEAVLHPYENIINNPRLVKNYDVVAVSFMVSDIVAVQKLLKSLKRFRENRGLVVLGGPGTLDEDVLKILDFDVAFIGEAEYTFHYLFHRCGYRSFRELVHEIGNSREVPKGLAIKRGNNVVSGGLGYWVPKDLLFKVIPEINDVKNYPYYWACRIYVEVVRGCSNFCRPSITSLCSECGICNSKDLSKRVVCPAGIPPGCGYCNVPLVHGYARSRDIYSIVEEVHKLIDLGATRIVLSAPDFLDFGRDAKVQDILTDPCNPSPNIDMIEKLLEELTNIEQVSEGKASISIENIKACLVNREVAEVLGKYLKNTAIYIGLESCSNKLLNIVGRPSKCEDVLNAIKLLVNKGLRPYVYLIHGLPHEDVEDIKKTIGVIPLLKDLGVERIVLYRFRSLPRTAFEKIDKVVEAIDPEIVKYREILKEEVRKFNSYRKMELIGRHIDVVIASKHHKHQHYLVGYPLTHGPVTLIKTSKRYIGYLARVKIVKALSDRIVLGEIIHIKQKIVKNL